MPEGPAAGLSTDKTTVLKMARTGRRVVSLVLVALPSTFAWLSIQNTSHDHEIGRAHV